MLFDEFEEIDSGVGGSAGSAFAWIARDFLLTPFSDMRYVATIVRVLAGYATFLFKYLDYWFVNRAGAAVVASAVYIIGRKPDK